MSKIITFGEALIDFVPKTNGQPLSQVKEFMRAPGGAPANVAVAIAKLGGNSYFAGKVGDDSFGHFLISMFTEEKVKTDYVLLTKEVKTALAFISLKENGERDFLFYRDPSADMLIAAEDLDKSWFFDAAIFHFGSNTLSYSTCNKATYKAIEFAKATATLISFDPNIRLSLWSSSAKAREQILAILPQVDILKVSEEEYQFLLDTKDEKKAANYFLSQGISLVIVTKGENGSSYYTKAISDDLIVPKVKAIDTTGAGDAFVGGLLYQLWVSLNNDNSLADICNHKEELSTITNFANACGALTATGRGAIPSLPDQSRVEKFILEQ